MDPKFSSYLTLYYLTLKGIPTVNHIPEKLVAHEPGMNHTTPKKQTQKSKRPVALAPVAKKKRRNEETSFPKTPVGLPQQIANTCFFNAACQAFRKVYELLQLEGHLPTNHVLTLYRNMVLSGKPSDISAFQYALRSHPYFASVKWSQMDDAIAFVDALSRTVMDVDEQFESVFSLKISSVGSQSVCTRCNVFEIWPLLKSSLLSISLDKPVSHSILAALLQSSSCLVCQRQTADYSIKFPQFLLIRTPRARPVGGAPMSIEKLLQIGPVQYQLLSIAKSSGCHATALCYYPEDSNQSGKWFECNDGYYKECCVNPQDPFFHVDSLPLGIIYRRVSECDQLSGSTIAQLNFENDVEWKLTLTVSENPKTVWPLLPLLSTLPPHQDAQFFRQAVVTGSSGLNTTHILIYGLSPQTFELVKNLVSMGYLNITIRLNPNEDLSNFRSCCVWATENIQSAKDQISAYYTLKNYIKARINPQARIKLLREEISEESLKAFEVSVLVVPSQYIFDLVELNRIARACNVKFIAGDICGLMISLFTDFGTSFTYRNATGNTAFDEMQIFFKEFSSQQVDELENCILEFEYYPDTLATSFLKSTSEFRFIDTIDNNTPVIAELVSLNLASKKLAFRLPLARANSFLELFNQNPAQVYLTRVIPESTVDFHALDQYCSNSITRPALSSVPIMAPDLEEYWWAMYKDFAQLRNTPVVALNTLDDSWLERQSAKILERYPYYSPEILAFSHAGVKNAYLGMCGYAPPMSTLLGGFLAHCVLVATTHRYPPVHQWRVLSFADVLDANTILNDRKRDMQDCFDPTKLLFGTPCITALQQLRVAQIGAGATGCETAKLLCEMGIARNNQSKLTLIDPDIFIRSNRNRQFLCGENQEFQPKAMAASKSLQHLFGPITIDAFQMRIDEDHCGTFPPDMVDQYDVIIGCVDNIPARTYCNELAHMQGKFFLECGTATLGISATSFVPATNDLPSSKLFTHSQPERVLSFNCNPVAFCFLDKHTIQYAANVWDNWFTQKIVQVSSAMDNHNEAALEIIKSYLRVLSHVNTKNYLEMIDNLFVELFTIEFVHTISKQRKSLLKKQNFCSPPTPISFDRDIKVHADLQNQFRELFLEAFKNPKFPVCVPFDKDCLNHLKFIKNLASIKCDCYDIKIRDFADWRVQLIAGHSIPSIITSTAVSASLNCLNMYRVASIKANRNPGLNNYCGNLGEVHVGLFQFSRVPNSFPHYLYIPSSFTLGQLKESLITECSELTTLEQAHGYGGSGFVLITKSGNLDIKFEHTDRDCIKLVDLTNDFPYWLKFYHCYNTAKYDTVRLLPMDASCASAETCWYKQPVTYCKSLLSTLFSQ